MHRSASIFKPELTCYFLLFLACMAFGINSLGITNISTPIFYLLNFIISISCIIISYKSKNGKFLYWLGFIMLGLILSCRDQMGIDDHVYKNIFENAYGLNLSQYFLTSGTEKGYLTINWLLFHLTNGNYTTAQFFISTFSLLIWAIAIKHNSEDFISASLMFLFLWTHFYFFVLSAGLVRFFIALPIVFFSLKYIYKKNLKKFLLCILIAAMFHLSALMMLILLPFLLWEKFFFKHWLVYIMIISIVVIGVFMFVASYLVPILGVRYE